MKVLGRGWQYTTYDLGNGHVLKKYNSLPTAYAVMLRDCFPYRHNPIWKLPSYYRGCKEQAADSIKKVAHTTIDQAKLGNPKILNALDYEQDKMVPICEYFKTATDDQVKEVIDKFVSFNKFLIDHGLIDKSFNIGKNFGLNKNNEVVLLDLGELYSSKDGIDGQRRKRMWAYPYVLNPIPNHLQDYFLKRMDSTFGI